MSDAPEQITAEFQNWRNPNAGAAYRNDAGGTPYLRADIADERIAQARAEALREAADRLNLAAEQWGSRGNEPTAAAVLRVEAKAILALIEKE